MAFEIRDVPYDEIIGKPIRRRREIMRAKVIAFWIVVECPHCHKPQVINKWTQNGVVYDFESVRSYECDLCENPYEFRLQVKENMGDPHLASISPSPVIEMQKD